MAIENAKKLNVRIRNKYDSYNNWMASGLILEAGEIAIAYTSVDVTVDGGKAKHPALLMKVGDGKKTFANLPWLSAKAADVLSVCKNETDLTAFVNSVIADAGIATDEAMEALAGRVTTAEGAIKVLQDAIGENGSVAKQIEDAIAALNLADTYAAKEHKHVKADIEDFAHNHEMADVEGLVDALAGKQAAGDYAAEVHTHVMADVTDLADELAKYQLVGDYATKAEAQAMADAKDEAIAAAKKAGDDAQADIDALELVVAKQADVNAALELKANQADLQAEIDRAKTAEEANAAAIKLLQGVDAETLADVENLVKYVEEHGPEVIQIQNDIEQNANDIDALEERMDDAETALGTVDDRIEAAITEANLGQFAKDADLDAAVERIVALETADDEQDTLLAGLRTDVDAKAAQADLEAIDDRIEALEGKVDVEKVSTAIATAIDDAVAKDVVVLSEAQKYADNLDTAMNIRVEALEAIDHDHSNKTVLDGISAEKVAAWDAAEANAKAHADELDEAMDTRVKALEAKDVVLYTDELIIDCGGAEI